MLAGPNARTMLEQPAPVIPHKANGQAQPASSVILSGGLQAQPPMLSGIRTPSTGNVVSPLPYTHGHRSTLWKDIGIGIGVAIAVVGGVLGMRALFMRPSKGTLVVMVNAAHAADVFVDGTLKGHVDPNAPLTLREIAAGNHAVSVRASDGAEYHQQVTLVANDVSVLTAAPRLAAAPTPGTGNLKLNLLTDGAQVYVDGAQLADGAWKEPIPLRSDVAHEIRVTKPTREEVKLSVTLRTGEAVMRDVDLLPAYGKVTIDSDPPGAEVSVNGKHSGVTPTTAGDLDPGKAARVTVRLHGYAPITKYVAFDKALTQTLDLTLVASNESGDGDKAARKDDELAAIKVAAAGKGVTGPSPTESGFLVANTQPWAKVFIDGKDTGKTTPIAPRSKIALKPGKHTVTFVANGKSFNFDVTIKPAEDTRLIKQLAERLSSRAAAAS